MNSEELAVQRSPGLKLDHGFLRKIEHNQHVRQQLSKSDVARKQEAAKMARKVGHASKSTRPTMEIYRPPNSLLIGMRGSDYSKPFTNGHNATSLLGDPPSESNHATTRGVHFQGDPVNRELKSALKRSKSFGATNLDEIASAGFDRETFPMEYQGLVKRAVQDPNVLSSRQLMQVVSVVCSKAVESLQFAEHAAQMCFTIIEKEKGETFLESLLNSCREWYNEREKLLRFASTAGGFRRWTAYVSFLTELYLRLKSCHRAMTTGSSTQTVADQTLTLLMLLYECLQIILKPPSLNNAAEIECLRSVLSTIGHHLEKEAPQRMLHLADMMRDAFINPSISAQVRKTLLEMLELHASKWQLDLPQSMYYFPYTSMDRK